jgi:diketogulonate reductase-like aldo/keto reductase
MSATHHALRTAIQNIAAFTVPLHTGRLMPQLGLGTYQLRTHTVETVLRALEAGYRMIDTAGDYHTQRGIGEALSHCDLDRSDYYVVTKIEETDDAHEAVRRNLAELRLNYADLVLIHRPPDHGVGEASWQGLRRAKQERLTRDIGVCNYSIEQIEELVYLTGEMPTVSIRSNGARSATARECSISATTTTSSSRPGARSRVRSG